MRFEDVMGVKEASERWGLSAVTVKQLCTGVQGRRPRLTSKECRKSGGIWLVTSEGMERLYGKEKEKK